MPNLEDLKKKIEDKNKLQKEATGDRTPAGLPERTDPKQVDKIVERMKMKYGEHGMEFQEVGGKLGELRSIIAEGEQAKINVQSVEDLQEFRSPVIQQLGRVYVIFKPVLEAISGLIKTLPITGEVRYYLYSANMKFSLNQWLALTVSASFIAGIFVFILMAIISTIFEISYVLSIVAALGTGLFTTLIMLLIPRSNASKRGGAMNTELPFALRHMATELKAGLGIYRTIQTIAIADYGVLSEEFARTVTEIEEGTDAKDALTHFAMRSQSKSLRNALLHVVRAMKTGGNLSEIMTAIAQDVSFDIRIKIKEYSEKMNFFGVLYIFIAIVAPVFLAILGSILNAPISLGGIAVPPLVLAGVYLVGMPLVLGFLIFYLKMTQPTVA